MVAKNIAGPGVVISFVIAALASIFSGNYLLLLLLFLFYYTKYGYQRANGFLIYIHTFFSDSYERLHMNGQNVVRGYFRVVMKELKSFSMSQLILGTTLEI